MIETETLKPIDKVFLGKIHESPGRNNSERDMASKLCIPESRAILQMAKAAWMDEIWLIRPLISAGWEAAARWQGHAEQLEKPSSSRREIVGAR